MPDLEQIAQVEGIDMLFFGPADFSQGIGDPGNFDNPRIAETRRLIAETARRHGKFAGTVASCDTLAATVALGYQFVSVGADVVPPAMRSIASLRRLPAAMRPCRDEFPPDCCV